MVIRRKGQMQSIPTNVARHHLVLDVRVYNLCNDLVRTEYQVLSIPLGDCTSQSFDVLGKLVHHLDGQSRLLVL